MEKSFRWLLLFLIGFVLSNCSGESQKTKLQYMPDMVDTVAPKAQLNYLDPPKDSISRNATLYPKTAEESEKLLHNIYRGMPEARLAPIRKNGAELFNTFCAVCHGLDAKGKGSIADVFAAPPDLTLDLYKNHADGFFFHRITFGVRLMSGYGHAISPHERWQIILHLRSLQEKK